MRFEDLFVLFEIAHRKTSASIAAHQSIHPSVSIWQGLPLSS
jgi:hypothetical protein